MSSAQSSTPPSSLRFVAKGRLMYCRASADEQFWADHWRGLDTGSIYDHAKRGDLGSLTRPFLRHLPKEGRILEGGCGLGQVVLALRGRGYDCEGVEWADETVARVKSILPDLPVSAGDVTALPHPERHFAAYISLGVVEHREAGPEPFLREAHRVLQDGGLLLISVPQFNILRRLRGHLGAFRGSPNGLQFYQWAFKPKEFRSLLERAGFRPIARYGYDAERTLRGELRWLRPLIERPAVRKWLRRALRRLPSVERRLGHMMLFVAIREDRQPEREAHV